VRVDIEDGQLFHRASPKRPHRAFSVFPCNE
jgi:hypothetical protein